MAGCPLCGTEIVLSSRTDIGDLAFCPECSTEFEISSMDPITFKKAENQFWVADDPHPEQFWEEH